MALKHPVTKPIKNNSTHGLGVMHVVSHCASSHKNVRLMEGVAVQGDEERPGLLGYCQGNTVLVLLLNQGYLKQP